MAVLVVALFATFGVADEPPPGEGASVKPASNHSSSARIVVGTVGRISRPGKNKFEAHCTVDRALSAVDTKVLKVDENSLLLRCDDDGRYTRIGLKDLLMGDPNEFFQASITHDPDLDDYTHLVFWLVAFPRGAKPPVLIEEEPELKPVTPE
ncbi:MAG TPA: hypothetical protein VFT74_17285 [Isosphaeraceae bacterium]|nr:hypothetical protein [Isosphaeraceae bacterium]